MKVKIFPSMGEAYVVVLPEYLYWDEEKVERWIEENLKMVECFQILN